MADRQVRLAQFFFRKGKGEPPGKQPYLLLSPDDAEQGKAVITGVGFVDSPARATFPDSRLWWITEDPSNPVTISIDDNGETTTVALWREGNR